MANETRQEAMLTEDQQFLISNMMMKKKGGKGRQRIEIKKMAQCSNRQVTFSKRRQNLFKKAEELALNHCNMRVAVFALSEKGTPYSYGNSQDADTLIDRFLSVDNQECNNDYNTPVSLTMSDNIEELEGYAQFLMEMKADVECKIDNTQMIVKNTVSAPICPNVLNNEESNFEWTKNDSGIDDFQLMNVDLGLDETRKTVLMQQQGHDDLGMNDTIDLGFFDLNNDLGIYDDIDLGFLDFNGDSGLDGDFQWNMNVDSALDDFQTLIFIQPKH